MKKKSRKPKVKISVRLTEENLKKIDKIRKACKLKTRTKAVECIIENY